MKIKKIKDTYNDYQCELSFGQLTAIRNALASEHSDPLADELFAELNWYLDNIPGPGESEDDLKAAEEAGESGLASPEAEGQPLKPQADDLLPAPGEEEMPGGEEMGGEMGGEEMGGEMGGEEGPEAALGQGPEEEPGGPPEGGEESEADRRLPPPEE